MPDGHRRHQGKRNGNRWYVGSQTGGSPDDAQLAGRQQPQRRDRHMPGVGGPAGLVQDRRHGIVATRARPCCRAPAATTFSRSTPIRWRWRCRFHRSRCDVAGSIVTIIPVGYQTRNFNAMSLVNFRIVSQAADGSEGLFFMNYENAPSGSDFDNDEKGFLHYIVSGNTIKVISAPERLVIRRQPEDGLHHRRRQRCRHALPGREQATSTLPTTRAAAARSRRSRSR